MTAQPARMRDEDRVDLAEHGRMLESLQHDVGELKMAAHEHSRMLRAIIQHLGIDVTDSTA